mgnify:CR=1 FL=1
MYNLLADVIILLHFLFIVFVILGGLLVVRWPKTAFIHLPAAVWGALVELCGWICPLTPLENHFRRLAGNESYSGDFIERYLRPLIYPENLTASMQQFFGVMVIAVNIIFYSFAMRRYRTMKKTAS